MEKLKFYEKQVQEGDARRGRIHTRRGPVETPCFCPVATHASVKSVDSLELKKMGVQMLLANAYHLHIRPGDQLIQKHGGLHHFMNWKGPILTDSGGYQVFSLSKINKITDEGVLFQNHLDGNKLLITPESSIEIQARLGADILMAFDHCPHGKISKKSALSAVERTFSWLKRSHACFLKLKGKNFFSSAQQNFFQQSTHLNPQLTNTAGEKKNNCQKTKYRNSDKEMENNLRMDSKSLKPQNNPHIKGREFSLMQEPALFGIVQGGMYEDLRQISLDQVESLDLPGIAVGGMSVGENKEDRERILKFLTEKLPPHKPRYLMGVGAPKDLIFAVDCGFDLFDCVLPTRTARTGRLWTWQGDINIRNEKHKTDNNPVDPDCSCLCCTHYSRSYLRHLFLNKELLAYRLATIHNIHFYMDLMKKIRQSIEQKKWAVFRDSCLNQWQK